MSVKNNQSSTGQAPKKHADPTPEKIAKTRMPGKIEQREKGERENAHG